MSDFLVCSASCAVKASDMPSRALHSIVHVVQWLLAHVCELLAAAWYWPPHGMPLSSWRCISVAGACPRLPKPLSLFKGLSVGAQGLSIMMRYIHTTSSLAGGTACNACNQNCCAAAAAVPLLAAAVDQALASASWCATHHRDCTLLRCTHSGRRGRLDSDHSTVLCSRDQPLHVGHVPSQSKSNRLLPFQAAAQHAKDQQLNMQQFNPTFTCQHGGHVGAH